MEHKKIPRPSLFFNIVVGIALIGIEQKQPCLTSWSKKQVYLSPDQSWERHTASLI
jgi:hypothetical protein